MSIVKLNKGDYVLATKYKDGDPKDHFCVGFFESMTWHGRYNIVMSDGTPFRHNGFRRAQKITPEVGKMIVDNIQVIEQSDASLWDWLEIFKNRNMSFLKSIHNYY